MRIRVSPTLIINLIITLTLIERDGVRDGVRDDLVTREPRKLVIFATSYPLIWTSSTESPVTP